MLEYLMKKKCFMDALAFTGHKMSNEEKIMSALGGLRPEYDPFVIHITSMQTSYSLPDISSLLLTHEARLDQHSQEKD